MLNLNLIGRRGKTLTKCAALARDVRASHVAVLDALDAIETAADIAVEVLSHVHSMRGGRVDHSARMPDDWDNCPTFAWVN